MTFLIALITFNGAIFALIKGYGEGLKPTTKKRIATVILRTRKVDISDWAVPFEELFNRVFTKRHFSFKCFIRSVYASILAMVIVTMLLYTVHPNGAFEIHSKSLFIGVILYNFIPDYVSLLESRYIISRITKTKSVSSIFGYLGLDAILTFMIFSLMVSFTYGPSHQTVDFILTKVDQEVENIVDQSQFSADYKILEYRFDNQGLNFPLDTLIVIPDTMSTSGNAQVSIPDSTVKLVIISGSKSYIQNVLHMMTLYWEALSFEHIEGYLPIFLYSTFFTSIWLWLYALSILALRLVTRIKIFSDFILKHWDVKNNPFLYIGLFANIIGTVLFLIWWLFIE